MPKENYFVITLELGFLALSVFFLIEVTSISAIQINYNHRMRRFVWRIRRHAHTTMLSPTYDLYLLSLR
jgi:hypothetical protein